MKPLNSLRLVSLLLVLPCAAQQIPVTSSIGYETANSSNNIVLTWESIPTKLYNVLTTTALEQQPWVPLNASPIYSSNNLVRYRDTNSLPARFYKVVKLDTDPPEIWRLNPGSNATAVARQSLLKAWLRDETAIDPTSLVLTVGTNPPATLADPRLAFTNGTLTYTPATNQFFGTNGQTVTATLAFSDSLGHRATNTWPFKLELTPILASNVIIITESSPLTFLSSNGNTYVFSYTGAQPGITNGHVLVSTDPNNAYKLIVLSLTDNPGAHTVSLVTTQASLADILLQGSVRFFAENYAPDGFRSASATAANTIDLSGTTLYDENDVTIEVTEGTLSFDPDFSISAEIFSPRSADLEISASVTFDLTLQASWEHTWSFSKDKRIGRPLRQFRLHGCIPIPFPPFCIPVWTESVWEFYIGAEGELNAQASLTAALHSTTDIAFGTRYRDGGWTPYSRETTRVVPAPVAFEGGGSGRLQGYVEPRLTVYLESTVGLSARVRPYVEVVANACVQPGQVGVDVTLYRGLSGTLAVDLRGWDEEWGDQPSEELFNVSQLLWHKNLTTPVGQAQQTISNMVWIPCGTFMMGSPTSEPARTTNESPQTRVTISQGFWMGKYEVKQSEYLAVMGSNPSWFNGVRPDFFWDENCQCNPDVNYDDLSRPVETVSWDDAVAYCAALTTRERNAGRLPAGHVYRLPTEAEWEYACRAGTTTAFHYGNELRSGMANFIGYYEYPPCGNDDLSCYNPSGVELGRTTSVGSYAPNAWGLYDMHGNVWEWCQDWWSSSLPGGSVNDPQGSPTGSFRVIRGGSWLYYYANFCRSACRNESGPAIRDSAFGFRVVLAPSQ